ncbi:hypothetical protein LJR225_003811 [Phenylobacterium sp. LjRoot225]|uniref:DUF4170 domain-containing protein n=1 Tax=Phenylobacterium sp. LjRoot225 TaxID=3342285 RepID=UPI003ED06553
MNTERFWVVGGEYSSTTFHTLKKGQPDVLGPFATRDEARAVWKQVSETTRSCATAKYSITAEQLTLPR